MTDSVERDVLHRALVEVQTWTAPARIAQQEQRVRDLEKEVERKQIEVRDLEARRDDLEQATRAALREGRHNLAFGFTAVTYILNEEIERLQPAGQLRKLQQARRELERLRSVAQVLGESDG